MTQQLEVPGQSGQTYRYLPLENAGPRSPTGANFLFVKVKGGESTIVYAGETECLHRGVNVGFERAKKTHGANAIFVRLNVTRAVREAELSDVLAQHQPPMNDDAD